MADADVMIDVDPLEPDPDWEDPESEEVVDDDRRRVLWAVLIAIIIVLAVAIWVWANTARVPDVVGLTTDSAGKRVEAAGFKVGEVFTTDDYEVAPGEIDEQGPAAGRRVLKGTAVVLVVAAEPTEYPEAEIREDADFGAGGFDFSDKETANVPDNYDPSTGYTQPKKSYKRVPQALNEPAAVGRELLTDAGYEVEVHYGISVSGVEQGHVFYQNPPPGAYEPAGTLVEIWIARGLPKGGTYPQPGRP